MKKYLIIGLIVAIIAAIGIVPLFQKNGTSDVTQLVATFNFKDNLAARANDVVSVTFEINENDLAKVELIYNDSLLKSYSNPTIGTRSFSLNTKHFVLGTKTLSLVSTLKNGETVSDDRLIRIVSNETPENWQLSIVKTYPHNSKSFTQGLEWSNGKLYESTGDPGAQGETKVGVLDLNTGNFTQKIGLDASYFGEGITLLNNKIYQLTYTQEKCFVYDQNTLIMEREMVYRGEGWGICNDGKNLYMSNGTERITRRNPKNFEILKTIEVYDDQGPISNLNELEYVDGLIYANVWQTNAIVVFEPTTGKVIAKIDASQLEELGRNGGDVLNGIAYSPITKNFYLTGKYWNNLFEVKFIKPIV